MKRPILLVCAGVLLAACASGSDVADAASSSPDSAMVDVLEGTAPRDSGQPGTP